MKSSTFGYRLATLHLYAHPSSTSLTSMTGQFDLQHQIVAQLIKKGTYLQVGMDVSRVPLKMFI